MRLPKRRNSVPLPRPAAAATSSTGREYESRYIEVVTVGGGQFVHYRDYWNPMVATDVVPQGLG